MGIFWSRAPLTKEEIKDTKVLIVGGGYGGALTGLTLKKAGIPFLLVEPKEFFYHQMAALRAAIKPEYTNGTTIPLREIFGENYKQASVVSVDHRARIAKLDNGDEERFTHLVLAVGVSVCYPSTTDLKSPPELRALNDKVASDVKKSRSVVIIGGGAVGVELAGEIIEEHPLKNITIIQSGDKLLSNSTDKNERMKINAQKALEARGVRLMFDTRVTNLNELTLNVLKKQTVHTTKGNFETDVVFRAIGSKPDKNVLSSILGKDKIDSNNLVKVDDKLQVEGLENVYAIGDCCNTEQEKMAAYAVEHGELVAQNIELELRGKEKKSYKARFNGMVVPIGSKDGVGDFYGWYVPSFFVRKMKSEDLLVPKVWAHIGLTAPRIE